MPVEHISVETKSVYGKTLVYPADQAAKEFIKHLGRKTFTTEDIAAVKALGIKVFITVNGIKVGEI